MLTVKVPKNTYESFLCVICFLNQESETLVVPCIITVAGIGMLIVRIWCPRASATVYENDGEGAKSSSPNA
jgi:hypothetical protein